MARLYLEKNLKQICESGAIKTAKILVYTNRINILLYDNNDKKVSLKNFDRRSKEEIEKSKDVVEAKSFKTLDSACNKLFKFGFRHFEIIDKRKRA